MQNVLLSFYRSARMTNNQIEKWSTNSPQTQDVQPHGKACKLNIGKTIPKLPEDKKCNTTIYEIEEQWECAYSASENVN